MGESRYVPVAASRSPPPNSPSPGHLLQTLPRQELLAWLNNLLQLNITKVEQCGTGYVPISGPPTAREQMSEKGDSGQGGIMSNI